MKINLKKLMQNLEDNQENITEELKKTTEPLFSTSIREQWLEVFRELKELIREIQNGAATRFDKDEKY